MKKSILNFGTPLSKSEQKDIQGGIFPPFGDCCSCIYVPAGYPYQVFITQSCSLDCPQNGDPLTYGDGC